MTAYIRVATVGGTAPVADGFDLVYSRDDATKISYDDADFFRKRAYEKFPEIDWRIEEVERGKYFVRGEKV